jgi:hypothetical protein
MPATERDLWELVCCGDDWLMGGDGPWAFDLFAYIEKVHAHPNDSSKGAFAFGVNYGLLRMALVATEIPFETVSPGKWQRNMKCLSKGDKNVTKARAQELFPSIKVTHAIADALLIAE